MCRAKEGDIKIMENISLFLEHAGELRINILRRKKGKEPLKQKKLQG